MRGVRIWGQSDPYTQQAQKETWNINLIFTVEGISNGCLELDCVCKKQNEYNLYVLIFELVLGLLPVFPAQRAVFSSQYSPWEPVFRAIEYFKVWLFHPPSCSSPICESSNQNFESYNFTNKHLNMSGSLTVMFDLLHQEGLQVLDICRATAWIYELSMLPDVLSLSLNGVVGESEAPGLEICQTKDNHGRIAWDVLRPLKLSWRILEVSFSKNSNWGCLQMGWWNSTFSNIRFFKVVCLFIFWFCLSIFSDSSRHSLPTDLVFVPKLALGAGFSGSWKFGNVHVSIHTVVHSPICESSFCWGCFCYVFANVADAFW